MFIIFISHLIKIIDILRAQCPGETFDTCSRSRVNTTYFIAFFTTYASVHNMTVLSELSYYNENRRDDNDGNRREVTSVNCSPENL